MLGETHLVIGDFHAKPKENLRRATILGRAIVRWRPSRIICLGDFGDFDSLSSYDRGTLSFEGRRVEADIEVVQEALKLINKPIEEYNAARAALKKKQYKPRMVMLGGNHDEGRIGKFVQANPELEGILSIESLGYEDHGWEYIPYGQPICIDGILYCHHIASGVMGRPIGGKNMARNLLRNAHMSVTVGHSHVFDFASEARADGRQIHGLSAGCYTEDTPDYAKTSAKFWWRGLILKTNVIDGDYNIKQFGMEELKELFG